MWRESHLAGEVGEAVDAKSSHAGKLDYRPLEQKVNKKRLQTHS